MRRIFTGRGESLPHKGTPIPADGEREAAILEVMSSCKRAIEENVLTWLPSLSGFDLKLIQRLSRGILGSFSFVTARAHTGHVLTQIDSD